MEAKTVLQGWDEPFVDRVLSVAAGVGALGGAIGGSVLGVAVGTAYPVLCGTLGSMLGSGLLACGWCLLVSVWEVIRAARHPREESTNAHQPITAAPSAG